MQCNANAMQCNAMQCNAMQCNAVQMRCNVMQCSAMHVQRRAMQCSAMQCNAMQRSDHVAAPVKRNAAAAAVKSFVGEKNLFFLSIDGFPPAPFRAAAYRFQDFYAEN